MWNYNYVLKIIKYKIQKISKAFCVREWRRTQPPSSVFGVTQTTLQIGVVQPHHLDFRWTPHMRLKEVVESPYLFYSFLFVPFFLFFFFFSYFYAWHDNLTGLALGWRMRCSKLFSFVTSHYDNKIIGFKRR